MRKSTLLAGFILAVSALAPSLAVAASVATPPAATQRTIIKHAQIFADSYAQAFVAQAKAMWSLDLYKVSLKDELKIAQSENLNGVYAPLVKGKYLFPVQYRWSDNGKYVGTVTTRVDATTGAISH